MFWEINVKATGDKLYKLLSTVPTWCTKSHMRDGTFRGSQPCLQGHQGDLPYDKLAMGWWLWFSELFSKIFRENNRTGFYLLLQPLPPGRLAERSRLLEPSLPEAWGVVLIPKFKFSWALISSPRNLTWTSCSGSQSGCPKYQHFFHSPDFKTTTA